MVVYEESVDDGTNHTNLSGSGNTLYSFTFNEFPDGGIDELVSFSVDISVTGTNQSGSGGYPGIGVRLVNSNGNTIYRFHETDGGVGSWTFTSDRSNDYDLIQLDEGSTHTHTATAETASTPGASITEVLYAEVYDASGGGDADDKATDFSGTAVVESASSEVTETFNYTGSEQTWTVPSGASSIHIECWGASGASGQGDDSASGDNGGYVSGDFTVAGGETLYIYVGGQGSAPDGGWPNGGDGGSNSLFPTYGGGGGGASDVRSGGSAASDRVIVAGGGGGGGAASEDGSATSAVAGGGQGGATATDGGTAEARDPSPIAEGGTGGGSSGANGGNGQTAGAAAGNEDIDVCGGGGGGGANGGGGGEAAAQGFDGDGQAYGAAAGGGGGDGSTSGVFAGTTTTGANSGDGQVTITYTGPPASPSNVTTELI